MRKTLLALALITSAAGCRSWPEANKDVRELRAIHKVYRDHSEPKDPTETADWIELGHRIDSILGHLDDLTK